MNGQQRKKKKSVRGQNLQVNESDQVWVLLRVLLGGFGAPVYESSSHHLLQPQDHLPTLYSGDTMSPNQRVREL